VLVSDDLGVPGFDLLVPAERADDLERELDAAGAVPVSLDILDVTRIEAGVPKFLVDMDTTTIPLEAGIEDRAISLTKGCYVGQEVIIRVLHRGGGRVAKKLVGIRPRQEVARGDRVWSGDREIGVITSAVVSPRFGPIALGYVHRDFTSVATSVEVQTADGKVPASVTAVPFAP
jgi:folate-binding protein YgfZ